MSALTLVLNQLPGVDPDEFRNVRSYYSCGKSYQEALKGSGPKSPLSTASTKSSSGVSSLYDEEITKPAKTKSKSITNSEEKDTSGSETEVAKPKVTSTNDHRIMYRGRNVLNLERNLQPHKWQLTSPLYGFYSKYSIYGEYSRIENSKLVEEYKMKTCEICDFYEPTPYQLLSF